MILCTFAVDTVLGRHIRLGASGRRGIVDLNSACAWHLARKGEARPYALADVLVPPDMERFLQGELTSMAFARKSVDDFEQTSASKPEPRGPNGEQVSFAPDSVQLLSPVPRPASLRFAFSYGDRVREGGDSGGGWTPGESPLFGRGNHQAVAGSGENVPWPSSGGQLEYGVSLAVVIGRAGRNINEADARSCIAGYTVINDFRVKHLPPAGPEGPQGPAMREGPVTVLGPVLVTADEIPDPYALAMTTRVNGEALWSGSTARDPWTIEALISYLSRDAPLFPGDVIGTCAVTKSGEPGPYRRVNPGEMIEIEVEVEKIGVLRNCVVRRA